jgi:hypothetical protein
VPPAGWLNYPAQPFYLTNVPGTACGIVASRNTLLLTMLNLRLGDGYSGADLVGGTKALFVGGRLKENDPMRRSDGAAKSTISSRLWPVSLILLTGADAARR